MPNPSPDSPSSTPSTIHGFALVIALSLMGFILLLLLALSSFVRVEGDSARNNRDKESARQNALLGVQVALGQIQKSLGPDQRVTARADILQSDLAEPYWTGVWEDPDPEDPTDDPLLRLWLVSGNTSDNLNYTPDTSPALADSIELLGVGSAEDRDLVRPPLVRFEGASNAYAYWVGDEGIKANASSMAEDYPARVAASDTSLSTVPLRFGFEAMTDFDTYSPIPAIYQNLHEPQQLALAQNHPDNESGDNIFTELSVKNHYSDLTIYSSGLLTDPKRGGLKWDLSALINLSASDFDSQFVNRMPGDRMLDRHYPGHGPRWDILREFTEQVRATTDISGIEAYIPTDDDSVGVSPIIAKFQMYLYVALMNEGLDSTTGKTRFRPRIYYLPAIVLWNPYDVTIQAPANGYQVRWRQTSTDALQFLYAPGYYNGGNWEAIQTENSTDLAAFPPLLKPGGVFEYLFFNIPETNIPPGEAIVFTPPNHQNLGTSDYSHLGSSGLDLEAGARNYGFYSDAKEAFLVEESDLPNTTFDDLRIDLRREVASLGNARFVGSLIGLYRYNSSQYYQLVNSVTFGRFMDHPTISEQSNKAIDEHEPDAYRPDILNTGLVSQLDSTAHRPMGLDISFISPELKRDTILASESRENARMLTSYNLRARQISRLDFSNLYNTSDWGKSGESRLYDAYPLIHYSPGGIDIQSMAEIETWDPDASKAYVGLSDSSITNIGTLNQATHYSPFHLPRGEHPYLSVGDLMHIDLAGADGTVDTGRSTESDIYGPSQVVGNSYAPMNIGFNNLSVNDRDGNLLPDYSWLINDELWDRFYVSTIPEADPIELPLVNSRYIPFSETENSLDAEEIERLRTYDEAARNLLIHGPFNVNSTSVEAWKTLLASYWGQTVRTTDGVNITTGNASPIVPAPIASGQAYGGQGSEDAHLFRGYRQLDQTEIQQLATAIVDEVRTRGPFLSLADFVNRSVNPNDAVLDEAATSFSDNQRNGVLKQLASDPRMMGTLQAAIDRSGLNDPFEDNWFFTKERTKSIEAERDSQPPNIPAAMGAYLANTPGYLSQTALLARLGSVLTVRSDTFIIRAYGDIREPGTDKVIARSWCEALVQRYPEYVNADADEANVFPPTDQINQQMGRKFRIIGFRWLNKNDV